MRLFVGFGLVIFDLMLADLLLVLRPFDLRIVILAVDCRRFDRLVIGFGETVGCSNIKLVCGPNHDDFRPAKTYRSPP